MQLNIWMKIILVIIAMALTSTLFNVPIIAIPMFLVVRYGIKVYMEVTANAKETKRKGEIPIVTGSDIPAEIGMLNR